MMAKIGDRMVSCLEYRKDAVKKWNQSTLARCSSEREGWMQVKMDPFPYFIICVQTSDFDEVERIIKSGIDVNAQGDDGITALHEACFHDDLDIAQLLLENGARVNLADNSGFTPLHSAATSASVDMLELLIKHGADPFIRNFKGLLPIEMCEEKEGELALYLQKRMIGAKKAAKDEAETEQSHFLEDVKKWIQNQELNNIRGPNGDTPLHLAASKGYLECSQLMVKAKINLETKDNDGWTPLHCAVYWGELAIVKLLVEAGADIHALETYGHTPYDFVDLLIKRIQAGQFFYPEDIEIQTEIKKYFDEKIRNKVVDLTQLGHEFVPEESAPIPNLKSILSTTIASGSACPVVSRPPTSRFTSTRVGISVESISKPPEKSLTASTSNSVSSTTSSGIKLPPSSKVSLPPVKTSPTSSQTSSSLSSTSFTSSKPISKPPVSTPSSLSSTLPSSVSLPPSSTSASVPPTSRVNSTSVSSTTVPTASTTSSVSDSKSTTTASLAEVISLRKEIESLKEKLAVKDRVIERLKKDLEQYRGY